MEAYSLRDVFLRANAAFERLSKVADVVMFHHFSANARQRLGSLVARDAEGKEIAVEEFTLPIVCDEEKDAQAILDAAKRLEAKVAEAVK